jgi:predicted nucleic acid-binding protein
MTFADLAAGTAVFLDANILVYHFGPHPGFGPPCHQLVQRIVNLEVRGFTATAVLSEAAHHLMTLEASILFGWPSRIVQHLKRNPGSVQRLSRFRQAIEEVSRLGIQVLTIPAPLVAVATIVSQQTGLLSNDALLVAVMQHYGLRHLASEDADFDTVPGITRYAPT